MTKYETARNKLIPLAEVKANRASGNKPPIDSPKYGKWCNRWNREFHRAMDRLARDQKLV